MASLFSIELFKVPFDNSYKKVFDINSIEDSKLYKIWDNKSKESKFYKAALNIWTKRDPLKRKTAKINKLNYLEIFYNDDYKIKIDNYFNNLDN